MSDTTPHLTPGQELQRPDPGAVPGGRAAATAQPCRLRRRPLHFPVDPPRCRARARPRRRLTARGSAYAHRRQPWQSTATSRAPQISRIRMSANRPTRLTSTASETLSTESRLTAERRGTGSSPGSRTTSLARPRIVVVHGATSARRCRGITASRDSTTTGRRPISGISHHHTSPRAGSAFMRRPLPVATRRGRPIRLARR